jgi:hypothetical protein
MNNYRIEYDSSLETTSALPIKKVWFSSSGNTVAEEFISSNELYELDREEFLRYYDTKINAFTYFVAQVTSKSTSAHELHMIHNRVSRAVLSIADTKRVLEANGDSGE